VSHLEQFCGKMQKGEGAIMVDLKYINVGEVRYMVTS